jgi:subtilase family serine protease
VTVVSNVVDGDEFTYLASGETATVVKALKSSAQTLSTTSNGATSTDTKYVKLTGDITFPGLTVGTKTLSTTTVNPAVQGTEYAIASVSTTSGSFVTSVDSKTSVNIGGDGEKNIQ